MRKKLINELLLGYLVFGIFSFLLVAFVSAQMVRDYLMEKDSRFLYDEAYYLTTAAKSYRGGEAFDESEIAERMALLIRHFSCSGRILTPSGMVVYDSFGSLEGTLIEDFDPIAIREGRFLTGNFYGTYSSEQLFVLFPMTGNLNTYGYFLLARPMSVTLADQDAILNVVYITFLILFAFSFVLLVLYRNLVGKPLKEITKAANEYAAGNLAYRFEVESQDEIGYLANTMNYMAYELAGAEESQRKFISNISHDFRSPLTSIKGYLEAMLDGTIPPEMHEKYLRVVLSEAERLTTLTTSTLKFQSVEVNGAMLDLEDFDINQVIRNTALSFEGRCAAKRITLDLTFSAKEMKVNADKSKIQQVLYNLTDNAIKFSGENSTIWLEVYDRYDKVFVSVKDRGPGIPKDKQKKIWTRFYKVDDSRGRDKSGTGLGLAICRDIITAHGQNIDVISTEGVGSEFIFTLNKSGTAE